MKVVILPGAHRAFRAFVRERAEQAGGSAAEKLVDRFRRTFHLLAKTELGSRRTWAPQQYKFIPVDVFHVTWRPDAAQPDVRLVVRIVRQRKHPGNITRGLQ